jgi:hypothetical protein
MFTPEERLRSWRKQRPGNQGAYGMSVTEEVGGLCYTGVGLLLIQWLYCCWSAF